MSSRSRHGLYATLLVISGCFGGGGGGSCDIGTPNGLAGNGDFQYECVGDGMDPECENRTPDFGGGQLPTRSIARTASFRLTFLDDLSKTVRPVSTNAVSGTGPNFTATHAGNIGFVVEGPSGTNDVEDAIRLSVADPAGIRISRVALVLLGDEKLVVGGQTTRFRVTATDARGNPLIGALPGTWEVEPQGIVELETDRFGACTLTPLAPGKVRLTARAVDQIDSIPLEVTASPYDPDPDAGSDAGTDGGADGSTDASTDGGSSDASQD